jgi:hypothetical protein
MSAPCCPHAVAATWVAALVAVIAAVAIGFAMRSGANPAVPAQPAAVSAPE